MQRKSILNIIRRWINTPKKLLIILSSFFVLLALAKAVYFTHTYGGTDLRVRIVGVRLLTTPHSPYFYKWQPGDSEFYLDPNVEAHRLVNGHVVTPATAAVIYPLAQLPYPAIRWIWSGLIVLATAAIIGLLACKVKGGNHRLWVILPVVLGMVCTDTWLFNIERGQMYIFYPLIITLMYLCYTSGKKYGIFVSGFLGGLMVVFRPFAAVLGLPFLLQKKWKWVSGAVAGLLLGILLFVVPFKSAWTDYFKAMQEYVNENMGKGNYNTTAQGTPMPAIIEGADNLNKSHQFNINRLDTTYHLLKWAGIDITETQSVIAFAVIVAMLSVVLLFHSKNRLTSEQLFLTGFFIMMLGEIFIIAPRGAYNVIQWIFPVTLMLMYYRNRLPLMIWLVTALLLMHQFPFIFPRQFAIAELIFFGLTLYAGFIKPGEQNDIEVGLKKMNS